VFSQIGLAFSRFGHRENAPIADPVKLLFSGCSYLDALIATRAQAKRTPSDISPNKNERSRFFVGLTGDALEMCLYVLLFIHG
jgi:hypothetical protein